MGWGDDLNSWYETTTGTGSGGGGSEYNVFTGGGNNSDFNGRYLPGLSELYNFAYGTIDWLGNQTGNPNLSNPLRQPVRELSGANRQHEMDHQRGVIRDEEARRNRLLADERARQAEMDRAASESAAAGRIGSRVGLGRGGVPTVMGDVIQGDLLGL